MNVPRNETGGAPCKLQCSAIRLNGNKAIACVNVRTISIENYETRKIEQPEIFARTKVSFFYSWLDKKKEFQFFLQLVWQKFFPGGWTKGGKEIASDARNAAILDCWHQASTLEIFQSDRTYQTFMNILNGVVLVIWSAQCQICIALLQTVTSLLCMFSFQSFSAAKNIFHCPD